MDDLSLVEGVVQGEVGERICQDQPTMVNHVESVLEDHEEVSIKDVLEEPQTMVKTVASESGDSSKGPLESPFIAEVTFVSRNVDLNGYGTETTEGSSHEPHVMVKTTDDLVVLKETDFEKAQDPSLRVDFIKENGETSLNEDQDSFKELPGDSSTNDVSFMDCGQPEMVLNHVESAMKEDEEMSMESVLEEPLEELLGSSSHEPVQTTDELVLKTITLDEPQDPSILAESETEANVRADLKDDQGPSIQTNVSLVEGVVEGNKCVVGECTCDCALINHVASEGQKIPLEGAHQDPFKVKNGDFSDKPQETADTIDQLVMKTTSLKETQDPYVPIEPVSEVDVETPSKDGQYSIKELLESPSPKETSNNEGFVQLNVDGNEQIRQFSDEQQGDATYVEGVVSGNECDEKITIEGVCAKPLEDPNGRSSDELEAIIKPLDESVVKVMPLEEDKDPFIPSDSVSEADAETISLKDVQEYSFKVPLVSSFRVNVPPIKANEYDDVGESNPFVLGIEEDDEMSIESDIEETFKELDVNSSYEPQEVVKEVDQPGFKALPLTKVQDSSVPVDSIKEVNVETLLKDDHDSLPEGDVQGKKDDEDSGSACHGPLSMVNHSVSILEDEEMCTECVLEKHFKELPEISSDELLAMVKTVESGIEANVETSSKDTQDSCKEPTGDSYMDDISPVEGVVQGNECREVREGTFDSQPTMVNLVESIMKDHEETSMEDVIGEPKTTVKEDAQDLFVQAGSKIEINVDSPFKEAQDSTKDLQDNLSLTKDETQAMVRTTNDQVVLNEMPLDEAQDDQLLGESVSEENIETLLKDAHDSLKVNVSPIEGIFQGKEYDEGGENGAITTFVESIMAANEDMSISEELIGSSLDVSDQSTLKGAQDPSLPVESVTEVNEETSFKDDKDSLKEQPESPSLADVSFDHIGESACHGSPATVKHVVSDFKEDAAMSEEQAMVDTNDELVLNSQHLKEAQDPFVQAELVIKVNVDTSFEDVEDSFETPLGSPIVGYVSRVEDFADLDGDQNDQVVSKVILIEETQGPFLPTESVNEVNVETSIEDAKDHSSMESLRSSHMTDISSIEGVVQDHECAEVGETACDAPLATVYHDVSIDSVLKDEKEVSMKDVHEESLKDPNESFLDELQTMVKTVDRMIQDHVPGAIQEKVHTKYGENATTLYQDKSLAKEIEDLSIDGVLEESLKLLKEIEDLSIEGDLEKSFKEQSGDSSNEPEAIVNTIDRSLLKQGQYSFVPGVVQEKGYGEDGENATTINHDESLTKKIEDLSIESVLQESLEEQVEDSSHEQEATVNTIDTLLLKEDQDPFVPGAIQEKEYTKDGSNVKTSIEDAKGQSSMESLRSFPMADVPSIEGFVQDNEDSKRAEVGKTECDGPLATINHDVSVDSVLKGEKEVSMKDVLEESLKEPNEPYLDELQTMVKAVDQTVQDPSVPGTIQEKEYTEGGGNATTVYHAESLAKEIKDSSIEGGDLEESFKEQVGHSSHEQESLVSSIVRSLLKEIPMKEDQNPYAPIESEVNVETSFQDVQDSESIGSPSLVDVFTSEEIVQGNKFEKVDESAFHGLPVRANHIMPVVRESEWMVVEGSSLVNKSSVEAVGQQNGQRDGQRNEMVGLVRTLLEEIRRIRVFYEEGLRQTTEIHLHMSQVLEKFDSDNLI